MSGRRRRGVKAGQLITYGHHVSEVYSPPRVTDIAQHMGLVPGFALDLTIPDKWGRKWDFSKPECRKAAEELLDQEQPLLLIGSPMCKAFSVLQQLNARRVDPAVVRQRVEEATEHIKFCVKLYWKQLRAGRFFLHEHPEQAKSWAIKELKELMEDPEVVRVMGHMCQEGMQ